MAGELIRLNTKQIFVDQRTMVGVQVGPEINQCVDREVETQDAQFSSSMRECTITLEDVHLQLGLPVDGYAVTGSASSTDWGAVCYELLGAIPDNINGDFRAAGELSWGSTMLATLYKEMCEATRLNKAKIGGPIGELCYRGDAPVI
ncbi:hypothetical protein J1N35_039945 [Gossypium stocksii]|uniref:Uncharacterized protein n=1 Tax=Gossypium stocksii TaxID=47602 RepID=A0A9D3ZHV4_9ROSI|nr:hypothetical protein J1N35_039945 [Gossypium stocksii]